MYPKTLEGLFRAIEAGSLQDAKNIIASVIDINAQHKKQHAFNFILNANLSAKDKYEILELLVQEGAIPVLSRERNVLAQIAELFGTLGIQSEMILGVIQLHPDFNNYYQLSHLQAIRGVMPDENSFNQKDAFDLVPGFYGLFSGRARNDWFTHGYDYLVYVNKGHYKGVNLAWMLMYYQRYEVVSELLKIFSRGQRLELAAVGPQKNSNIHWNFSFLSLAVTQKNREIFIGLTRDFDFFRAEQCFEPFIVEISNPNHSLFGMNSLLLLARAKNLFWFENLEEKLNLVPKAHRFNALCSASENPSDITCGVNLAYELLLQKRFKLLSMMCDELEDYIARQDIYALLMSSPKNPDHPNFLDNFAKLLLDFGQLDLFCRLAVDFKDLSLEQRVQLALSIPLWKVFDRNKELFEDITKGFEKLPLERRFDIFSSMVAELIERGSERDLAIIKGFEDFDVERRFELLMSMCNDRDSSHAAGLLLGRQWHAIFDFWTNGLSAEQNLRLLLTVPKHTAGSILAHSLIDFDDSLLLRKMLVNLSNAQLIEVLAGRCVMRNSEDGSTEEMTMAGVLAKTDRILLKELIVKLNYEERAKLLNRTSVVSNEFYYLNLLIIEELILEIKQSLDNNKLDVLPELLRKLATHYELVFANPKPYVNKELSDLILFFIAKGYKENFADVLGWINLAVYLKIKKFAPDFALEGLAFYLKHFIDDESVISLAITYAEMLQQQCRLQDEVKRRSATDVVMSDASKSPRKPPYNSPNRFGLSSPSKSPGKSPGKNPLENHRRPLPSEQRVKELCGFASADKENTSRSEDLLASLKKNDIVQSSDKPSVVRTLFQEEFVDKKRKAADPSAEQTSRKKSGYTIADLFTAVDDCSVVEIRTIIQSKQFDLNELHEGKHIVAHLLDASSVFPDTKLLVHELIAFGVIPQPDENDNLLIKLAELGREDKNFLDLIVAKIKNDVQWLRFYSLWHIQALRGIHPGNQSRAMTPDRYGLLPIHYAFASGAYTVRWLWSDVTSYDFIKPVQQGFLQGTNLLWFLARQDDHTAFFDFIDKLDIEKRYMVARTAAKYPRHPLQGITVSLLLAYLTAFKRLTNNFAEVLSPELRYELLAEKTGEGVADLGSSIGFAFLKANDSQEATDYFISLCNGFEALALQQRAELLNQRPSQATYDDCPSVAIFLLCYRKQDFVKLMTRDFHRLDADSKFIYLSSNIQQLSVAGFYVRNEWFDELFDLLLKPREYLDGEQYTEIFLSKTIAGDGNPTSVLHALCGATVMENGKKRDFIPKIKNILMSYDSAEKLKKLLDGFAPNSSEYSLIYQYYLERLISEFGLLLTSKNVTRNQIFDSLKIITTPQIQSLESIKILFEHLGMLLADVCKTRYKTIVQEFFVKYENPLLIVDDKTLFVAVNDQVPGYGLEGIGICFRMVGYGAKSCVNDAIAYARLCKSIDELRIDVTMPRQSSVVSNVMHHAPVAGEPVSPSKRARGEDSASPRALRV